MIKIRENLKNQFIFIIIVVFLIPIILVITFLFYKSYKETKATNEKFSINMAEQTCDNLDNMILSLYNTSDFYLNDSRILSYMKEDYENMHYLKQYNTQIMGNIFSENDSFHSKKLTINALLGVNGELFNFMEPQNDGSEVIDILNTFQIESPEHYAIMKWQPLMDNFFVTQNYDDIRESKMILGSRRTYHRYTGVYLGTHIFVIPEKELYERYHKFITDESQIVFILDTEKELLSTNVEPYLEEGIEPGLYDLLLEENLRNHSYFKVGRKEYFISYKISDITGWHVIILTPTKVITKSIISLFVNVITAIIVFVILFVFIIVIFTSYIAKPLNRMIQSMQRVENGDFQLIPEIKYKNEIGMITRYYNHMVYRLDNLIKEKYEKEKKSRELEYKVLMGQINPHFIYNTLETIVWKANQAKLPEVSFIASQLGRLLRSSVSGDSIMLPIEQEINQLKLYIEIQKIRYKERLVFELGEFSEEISQYKTLRFILQPIVENAIAHGMKGSEEILTVAVNIYIKEDKLFFIIKDDGIGMSTQRLNDVKEYIHSNEKDNMIEFESSGSGIGMKNIQERLNLYFGEGYGVEIISSQSIGTSIIIKTPVIV